MYISHLRAFFSSFEDPSGAAIDECRALMEGRAASYLELSSEIKISRMTRRKSLCLVLLREADLFSDKIAVISRYKNERKFKTILTLKKIGFSTPSLS